MTTLYKNIRQIWSQSKVQENVSVVVEDQKIKKIGDYNALVKKFSKAKTVDCSSEVWFPAFSECHTHLVYGGSRQKDFALRMTGKTYAEVAALGGGILSTIKPTRELSLGILYEKALIDLQTFEKQGVGALEIKSGYGLTLESELKILKVIQKLKKDPNIKIVSTFMPAHAIPPEFKGKAEDFVDVITKEWIPEVARQKLADFFDVFIEDGYFNVKQAAKMCKKAKDLGLKIKLHVDQFKDIGGVDFSALSAALRFRARRGRRAVRLAVRRPRPLRPAVQSGAVAAHRAAGHPARTVSDRPAPPLARAALGGGAADRAGVPGSDRAASAGGDRGGAGAE
jgi:imidazolonepropionase